MIIFAKLFTFYTLFAAFGPSAQGAVHDYETVRTKGTAGAGVGSILMNESAVFNPAPVAFFKESSIYLDKSSFESRTTSAQIEGRNPSDDNDTYSVIVADGGNGVAGALSYQSQEENPYFRKRFSVGTGHKFSDSSSAGVGYRYTHDTSTYDPKGTKHHQFTVGASHVLSENLTMGLLYVDPMAMVKEDSRGYFGFQWFIKSFVALMGDMGGDFRRGLSETLVYRGAIQLSFFEDFYLRAGLFDDNAMGERGNGIGGSWIGPKLSIDIAMKDVKPDGNAPSSGTLPASYRETCFALAYRF